MKSQGRNSKLVTAYATLATVAIGILALDFANRSHQSDLLPNFPAPTLAAQSSSSVAAPKPPASTESKSTASLPKAKKTTSGSAGKGTIAASYAAPRP